MITSSSRCIAPQFSLIEQALRSKFMHRFVLPALGLFCLFLQSGCLCCPYPRIGYTPQLQVGPEDEVRAFRVDAEHSTGVDLGGIIPGYLFPRVRSVTHHVGPRRLTELAISSNHVAPEQIKASLSYAHVGSLFLLIHGAGHCRESLAVKLYRPGYKLVAVESWDLPHQPQWRPTFNLEGQEQALDALFELPLEAGSISAAHRQALLFGASEYDRLADCLGRSVGCRLPPWLASRFLGPTTFGVGLPAVMGVLSPQEARLAEKASTLRELAERTKAVELHPWQGMNDR